jgi:hypothetical protein
MSLRMYEFLMLQGAYRSNFWFTAFSIIQRRTYEHYEREKKLMQGYKTLYGNKYSKNMEFILKRIFFRIVAKYDDRGKFIDLRVDDSS